MDLEERVARLERNLKVVIVLLVVAILLIAFTFLRLANLEALRVQRLEIVDGQGRVLILLGRNPFGQPVLIVHDTAGRQRFGVSLDEHGDAMVSLWNAQGQEVATMGR